MSVSYQVLYDLLAQQKYEQPKEFFEVINLINDEQNNSTIYELLNYLAQKEVQCSTYSHV